jgi:demethylmenaquinone methyltransferase/2-methoxy-6-polyprenyl-1,4-benzoquinol methylase
VRAGKEVPPMSTSGELAAALAAQVEYYRHRAGQPDRGRNGGLIAQLVEQLAPSGHALELACGGGKWTMEIAPRVESLTALDAAPEVIEIARRRVRAGVDFVVADVFEWEPPRLYDTVFFGFWLSHVPPQLFAQFWNLIDRALAPGGHALFVDDGPPAFEAFKEVAVADAPIPSVKRTLPDGSSRNVVKLFYEPNELTELLAAHGWQADVWPTGDIFIAGSAQRCT